MTEHVGSGHHWERRTLQKVLLEHIKEQRRARRWSIFFKLMIIIFIAFLIYNMFHKDLPQPISTSKDHTALIKVKGEIESEKEASAENIRDALHSAFKNKHVKGIVLEINSPGGSPVQARQVYEEIRSLRTQHPHVKVYAAIADLGASAAYLIASAADAIYADKTSLVGSIGVISDSFGFVELMKKVGIERRLYTSGKHKAFLDPFSPKKQDEVDFFDAQLKKVHEVFISNVREGRGTRLHETDDIFSGYIWCGEDALALGLMDGYGDAHYIAKEIIHAPDMVDYTTSATLLDKLANRLGASVGQSLSAGTKSFLKGL